MRYLILLAMLFSSVNAYGVSLSQEQFDNMSLIDREMRANFPTYKGMHGAINNMTVIGIGDSEAQGFIDALVVDNLKEDDPKRKNKKSLRKKLKALGLNNEDLELLRLKNDIPDGV